MNLFDSKKKLGIAGVIMGLVAATLAYFGNPANMAICIACFVRDTAGALDFIPQSRYSMQDRKSSESSSVHLLFQLRQKNIVQQPDLPQLYVLYLE